MCAMSDCPQWHDDAACPFTVEDLEMNDGSPDKPYYMSKGLMGVLGKKNKKEKPEKKGEKEEKK